MAGKLIPFSESNSLPSPSQSYHRNLETCDALLTLSIHLQVALDRGMEESLSVGLPT